MRAWLTVWCADGRGWSEGCGERAGRARTVAAENCESALNLSSPKERGSETDIENKMVWIAKLIERFLSAILGAGEKKGIAGKALSFALAALVLGVALWLSYLRMRYNLGLDQN